MLPCMDFILTTGEPQYIHTSLPSCMWMPFYTLTPPASPHRFPSHSLTLFKSGHSSLGITDPHQYQATLFHRYHTDPVWAPTSCTSVSSYVDCSSSLITPSTLLTLVRLLISPCPSHIPHLDRHLPLFGPPDSFNTELFKKGRGRRQEE